MYPRNAYYENTDIKNRENSGEDVLKTAEQSALRSTLNTVINGDTKTIYHVGFGLGAYLCVVKKLYPELKVYGCEFDPMFFNFAQVKFNINSCVESVHIWNSYDAWKISGSYDVVFVEDWVNSLDKNAKAEVFKKVVGMAKQTAVFEKLDLDFEYNKGLYSVEQQENGTVTAKFLFNLVWGPELKFTETKTLKLEEKQDIENHLPSEEQSKEVFKDDNWADLGEHPPINGETPDE